MMTIALLLLLGTAMLSAKWRLGGFFDDYLDKDRCNAVKGIFIMLVFLSHFSQYVAPGARLAIDAPYYVFRGQMGQFVVALFLFYSGFGVMVSMKKGGKRYVDAMPRRRVLPTLLNFDIAVLCYFVLAALTHADIGAKKVFLSLVAWNSLGNSNWYIFAILLCYMVTWAAARFFDEENSKVLLSSGGVVLLLIIALSFFKKSYWYNTMLCYVAGMVYAHYRLTLEKVIKRNYWLCVFAVLCVLVLS